MRAGNRLILRSRKHTSRLARFGFVKIQLLTDQQAGYLRSFYGGFKELRDMEQESSLLSASVDIRESLNHTGLAVLGDSVARHFVGYESFISWIEVRHKRTQPPSLRSSWSMVDETRGIKTYNVWIPLQDIDGHNGQLTVIPYSHLFNNPVRGEGIEDFAELYSNKLNQYLVALPLHAGEAVIFDNSLLRSRLPNFTNEPSYSVALGLRSTETKLSFYQKYQDKEDHLCVQRHSVGDSFFWEHAHGQGIRSLDLSAPSELLRVARDELSDAQIDDALRGGHVGHFKRWVRRALEISCRSGQN